jgi:hypothetical protein
MQKVKISRRVRLQNKVKAQIKRPLAYIRWIRARFEQVYGDYLLGKGFRLNKEQPFEGWGFDIMDGLGVYEDNRLRVAERQFGMKGSTTDAKVGKIAGSVINLNSRLNMTTCPHESTLHLASHPYPLIQSPDVKGYSTFVCRDPECVALARNQIRKFSGVSDEEIVLTKLKKDSRLRGAGHWNKEETRRIEVDVPVAALKR